MSRSSHEGRDHGRRRGHPAAPAHLQRPQADDAAGQPADDGAHRRPAEAPRLRRDRRHRGLHGQRHPHLLRRRLRVRRAAWSTPPRRRPLGTAGSVRNAMDAPRRALPRDLRRRAHRHRPRGASSTSTTRTRRWPRSAWSPSRTRSSSASSSPARTARIERFLEKPTWGQVFSDTINTGIFVLEPEIFDYIEADRPVDFSERGLPEAARGRQPLYGAVAEGYWEDVGTLDAYVRRPQGHPRRQGRTSTSPASSCATACWLGEGAEIHPEATVDGPAVIGDNCRIEAGARLGEYTVLGANVRVRGRGRPRAHRRPRQRLPRRGGAPAGHRRRPRRATCAAACACEEGVGARRRVLRRRGRRARRRASRSTRSRRSRPAPSSTPRSCGSRAAPAALFGRDGVAGLANVDITPELATKVAMAYGTHAQEGRHGHHVARLEPLGPHAEAGDDGRASTPPASTSMDLEVASRAGHPLHRPPPGGRPAASRSGWSTATRSRCIIRFFDTDGLDISEDDPAQDRAPLRP